jgi:hypothetical protein
VKLSPVGNSWLLVLAGAAVTEIKSGETTRRIDISLMRSGDEAVKLVLWHQYFPDLADILGIHLK